MKDSPARAKKVLLEAFQEVTGLQVSPAQAMARLWTYAQTVRPIAKSCLWDEKRMVGTCGDWFTTGLEGGGQIEHAYMSGLMLARRISG